MMIPIMILGLQLFLLVTVTSGFQSGSMTMTARTRKNSASRSDNGIVVSRLRPQRSMRPYPKRTKARMTRLKYSNTVDEYDSEATGQDEDGWFNKLFNYSSGRRRASDDHDQKSVDTYLEFLNRRYRRIHDDDDKEGGDLARNDDNTKKTQSSSSSSFSAMDWLMNGSSNDEENIISTSQSTTTREQQQREDDALHILGLAGLASQELLQKHSPSSQSATAVATATATISSIDDDENIDKLKKTIDNVIDVDEIINDKNQGARTTTTVSPVLSMKNPLYTFVLNNILIPFVHIAYCVEEQKQSLKGVIQTRVVNPTVTKVLNTALVRSMMMSVQTGNPKLLLTAFLDVCGGKRNIVRTAAFVYGTIVIVRPVLQTIFSEGNSATAFPPY